MQEFLPFSFWKSCTVIRYGLQSQLSLEGFEHSFDQQLNPPNRCVVLASGIHRDELARVYYRKMDPDRGAPTLSAGLVIGAVIMKHLLNIDDREVVRQITENSYLQYFVGLPCFQKAPLFDASLLVRIRKRFGQEWIDEFNTLVLKHAGAIPSGQNKQKNS